MSPYKHVFQPLQIGGCLVPNRVCRTAHGTGLQGDELIAYHLERARGGVGLSILEAGSVHASAPFPMDISNDQCIDTYRKLMAAVRPHGMRVFQQLYYPGAVAGLWSASELPNPLAGLTPYAMTQADIDEIIDSFVGAALRCQEGGLDGVDIHASSGYLLHEFLSPALNQRQDGYGGSWENRLRLTREVIEAVRAAVEPHFVVGVRLPNEDYTPGGLGPAENARIALALEPLVDYVSLHMGSYWRFHKLIAPTDDPLGVEMPFNRPITAVVTKPRMVVGRIMTLDHAEALVRDGEADMVSMVRALIADPYLVNKAKAGQEARIRPCIGTNQGCVGRLMESGRISCVVNVAAAQEQVLAFEPATADAGPKTVLVVGGGAAGMEAARTAALRGHRVTLLEAMSRLGGQLAIAAAAPHRADLGSYCSWLQDELAELGVEVRLNCAVDAAMIEAFAADEVILALGSLPRYDGFQVSQPATPIPGFDRPQVIDSWRLFGVGDAVEPQGPVVVFDDCGGFEAISAVDQLLQRGLGVTLVSRLQTLGESVPYPPVTVAAARERLMSADFDFIGGQYLRSIDADSVEIGVLHTARSRTLVANCVVLVGFNQPNRELALELDARGVKFHSVGDMQGTRDLLSAVHAAARVARSL